jgi:hypothetical protein
VKSPEQSSPVDVMIPGEDTTLMGEKIINGVSGTATVGTSEKGTQVNFTSSSQKPITNTMSSEFISSALRQGQLLLGIIPKEHHSFCTDILVRAAILADPTVHHCNLPPISGIVSKEISLALQAKYRSILEEKVLHWRNQWDSFRNSASHSKSDDVASISIHSNRSLPASNEDEVLGKKRKYDSLLELNVSRPSDQISEGLDAIGANVQGSMSMDLQIQTLAQRRQVLEEQRASGSWSLYQEGIDRPNPERQHQDVLVMNSNIPASRDTIHQSDGKTFANFEFDSDHRKIDTTEEIVVLRKEIIPNSDFEDNDDDNSSILASFAAEKVPPSHMKLGSTDSEGNHTDRQSFKQDHSDNESGVFVTDEDENSFVLPIESTAAESKQPTPHIVHSLLIDGLRKQIVESKPYRKLTMNFTNKEEAKSPAKSSPKDEECANVPQEFVSRYMVRDFISIGPETESPKNGGEVDAAETTNRGSSLQSADVGPAEDSKLSFFDKLKLLKLKQRKLPETKPTENLNENFVLFAKLGIFI